MLNAVDAAVLAVNESDDICFCNQAFEGMTGYQSKEVLGQSLSALLPSNRARDLLDAAATAGVNGDDVPSATSCDIAIQCPDRGVLDATIEMTFLDLESEQLRILIVKDASAKAPTGTADLEKHQTAVVFIEALNHNRCRLRDLETVLYGLSSKTLNRNQPVIQELKSIDSALAGLEESLNPDAAKQDNRRLAVALMNHVLEYWEEATGKGKASLARQSGIWKVYMDKNGWERTQTLDKYMDIRTLPKRPRWKMIFKTADFVLAACNHASPLRNQVETLQNQLWLQI
jgi:two-component system sensor histidine kinase ChiS